MRKTLSMPVRAVQRRRPSRPLEEVDHQLRDEIVRVRSDEDFLRRVKAAIQEDRRRRPALSMRDMWTTGRLARASWQRAVGQAGTEAIDILAVIREEDAHGADVTLARALCDLAGYRIEIAPYVAASADAAGWLDQVPIEVRRRRRADELVEREVADIRRARQIPTSQEQRLDALFESLAKDGVPQRRGRTAILVLAQRVHTLTCARRADGTVTFSVEGGVRRNCDLCSESLRTLERWLERDVDAKRLLSFFGA